jgi:hypothetical protein
MHPQLQLPDRYKALLFREEGMLLVGMDDFADRGRHCAMRRVGFRGEGEIDQIVIGANPDVQDGFVCKITDRQLYAENVDELLEILILKECFQL